MAIITEVRRVRKTWYVFLDTGERLKLSSASYHQRPLQEGDTLDLQEYDQWLLLRQYPYALDRAVSYLAARACSRKEISDKLTRIGYRPCTVEMVLYKLESNRLLDDEDFARQWAAARTGKKLGPRRIAQELRLKGIDQDTAHRVLESVDEEAQTEAALSLVRRQLTRQSKEENPQKLKARLTSMLVRKGYGWDLAAGTVSQALREIGDPNDDSEE